jgi:hypothetical protein
VIQINISPRCDQRGLESITAFAQGLAELGWTVGRNRWGAGDLDRLALPRSKPWRLRRRGGLRRYRQ